MWGESYFCELCFLFVEPDRLGMVYPFLEDELLFVFFNCVPFASCWGCDSLL